MTDAAIAYDVFEDVFQNTTEERPVHGPERNPYVNQSDVLIAMLGELDYEGWNSAVRDARQADPEWSMDFSGARMAHTDMSNRDFKGADFTDANLQYCNFQYAKLEDTKFRGADVSSANFSHAQLNRSDLRNASRIDRAEGLRMASNYTPPLPDVSEAVARHYLRELINDPNSEINEGLPAMLDSGMRLDWSGDKLRFWVATEIERCYDACREGECECEIDHACQGGCDCCACYSGNCDCEPDHEYGGAEPSGDIFLATIIGAFEFRWSDTYGLQPTITMTEATQHPHVSGGSICWGDTELPRDSFRAVDHLLTVMGWMNQHDPNDENSSIHNLPKIR